MSQDQPTESFDPRAADAPTVRFNQQDEPPHGPQPPQKGRSRTLIIVLSVIGGLLLIAVVIFLTLLLARGTSAPNEAQSASPSASTQPSDSPSPSPSETPSESPSTSPSASVAPPPSTKTAIDSFTVSPSVVLCNTQSPVKTPIYVTFTWKSTNVNQVGFGVASDDGIAQGMGFNLPPTGNSTDDFPPGQNQIEFPCPSASQFYTLTVIGPDGKFTKKVTVTNNGDRS